MTPQDLAKQAAEKINADVFVLPSPYEDDMVKTIASTFTPRIKKLEGLVREHAELLAEAAEVIEGWGVYADSYFQDKWNLIGDIKKYKEAAVRATAALNDRRHDLQYQTCGVNMGGNATCKVCGACYCLPPWTMQKIRETEICKGSATAALEQGYWKCAKCDSTNAIDTGHIPPYCHNCKTNFTWINNLEPSP